jgi:hypothetical protein
MPAYVYSCYWTIAPLFLHLTVDRRGSVHTGGLGGSGRADDMVLLKGELWTQLRCGCLGMITGPICYPRMILAPELGSEICWTWRSQGPAYSMCCQAMEQSLPLAFRPQSSTTYFYGMWADFVQVTADSSLVHIWWLVFWWSWSLTNCSKQSLRQLKINDLFPDTARSVVGVQTNQKETTGERLDTSISFLQTTGKWFVGKFQRRWGQMMCPFHNAMPTSSMRNKCNSPYNQSVPWRGKPQFSNPCFGDKNTYVRSLGCVIWNLSGTGFVAGRQTG